MNNNGRVEFSWLNLLAVVCFIAVIAAPFVAVLDKLDGA